MEGESVSAELAALDDTPPGVGDVGGRVAVTSHAKFAFLARVDPTANYPAARLRELWEDSVRSDHPDARRAGRYVLIYDTPSERESVLLTVYPADRCPPGRSER